mmetsp:Transcript_37938/g.91525  ORF Transcript_37938/g.91525 Transcript_37938/m.91525 type:complete len:206 (-) Transcript_37938:334-951(-)
MLMVVSDIADDGPSSSSSHSIASEVAASLSSSFGSSDANADRAAGFSSEVRRAPMTRCGRGTTMTSSSSPSSSFFFFDVTSAASRTAPHPPPLFRYRLTALYDSASSLLRATSAPWSPPSSNSPPTLRTSVPRLALSMALIMATISSPPAAAAASSFFSIGGKYATSHRSPYRSTATIGRRAADRTFFPLTKPWFLSRRSAPTAA